MRRTIKIGSFLFLCCLFIPFSSSFADTETLTMSTYYPAPFGAYDRLQLVPRGGTPTPCAPGTLYVVDQGGGNYQLEMCGGGLGGPVSLSVWTQTGNDIYPKDGVAPNVGIGLISPLDPNRKLQVAGDSLFDGDNRITGTEIIDGNLGVGKTPGAGRRLDVEGDGQVNRLFLKANGSDVGELMVEYDSGTNAYYATYAP